MDWATVLRTSAAPSALLAVSVGDSCLRSKRDEVRKAVWPKEYPFGLLRKANPADEPSKAWLLLGERRDVGHGHQRL